MTSLMGQPTADGRFGPGTLSAVKAAQARAKLSQTGVVATLTWWPAKSPKLFTPKS